jgi:CBS domain containing-hemolysin-like protein
MLLFVTAVAVVLIVSFTCSIFESVLLSLTRPQIAVMSQQGKHAGSLLSGFKDNMDVPIAAILILNTAAHTVGAAVAGASYSNVFSSGTLWIFSIVFTIAVLLFTEIIPKTLGVTHAVALASPVAHGIAWLTTLLKPLVWLSEKLSRKLRQDIEQPVTSAEEIRLLAILGRTEGVVGQRTAGMIVGATQLRHLHADDVMLPREQVHFLTAGMDRTDVLDMIRSTGHSRFPFSPTSDLNDATGVVMAKELLVWLLQHEDVQIDWPSVTQEPLVVPRAATLPQLMRTYQESHRHLALVVDEYGSVDGIATLEDVLEEIVGDIRDESDSVSRDLYRRADGTLVARATVDLRKISSSLGVAWSSDTEATSIGGLVTERLERIPVAGDTIDWNGYRIEVLRADRRRARLVAISRQ